MQGGALDMASKSAKERIRDLMSAWTQFKGDYREESRHFDRALETVERRFDASFVSQIQFVNLAEIVASGPGRPEELSAKMRKEAERVIRASLGPDDLFVRDQDDLYRFCFPGRSRQAVARKLLAIRDQVLRALYKSDPSFANLAIRDSSRALDGDYTRERRLLSEDTDAIEADASALDGTHASSASGPDAGASGPATPRPARESTPPRVDENTRVRYHACWNVKKNYLTAFLPDALIRVGGTTCLASSLYGLWPDDGTRVALDRLQFRQALETLDQLQSAGRPIVVWIPVSFRTVARYESFASLMSEYTDFPDGLRKLVMFELLDTPDDADTVSVQTVMEQLKLRCRSIAVRLTPKAGRMQQWRNAGVHAVGFHRGPGDGGEDALIGTMERFAESAAAANLFTYILGADSLSLVTAAVTSGFDYVAGDAIVRPVDSPNGISGFAVSDLVAPLLAK